MVKLRPGYWSSCAIGAAGRAVGIPVADVERILDEWPWLEVLQEYYLCEIITLFDERVCRGEMTFDQLVAHVAQIEPPCECGVRDCVCDRIEGLLPASVEVVAEEFEPAF